MMAQRPTNIDNTITGRSGSGSRMHVMSNSTPFRQSPPPSLSPPFVFGQQQQHHYVETKSPLLQSRGDGHRKNDTTNSRSGEDGHQHHEQQQQQLNMDNMFSNNNTTSNSDHVNVDADVDSSSYNYSFDDDDDDDNNDNDGSISSRKNNPLHSSFDDSLLLRREEEEAERGGTTSSIGYNNTAATPFAAPKEGTRINNNVDRTLFGNSYMYDGGRSILDDDDEDENSNFRIIDMENASFSKSNNNQNQNDPNNNDNDINNNHEENNTNHNSTLFSPSLPSLPSSSSSLTGGKKNSYQHLRRPTRRRSVSGGCSQELNPNKPVVPDALGKNSTVRTKGTFTPATTRRRRRSGDTATTLSSSSFSLSSSTLSKTPTPVRTPISTRAAAAAASSSSSTAQKRRLAPSVYPARQSPMRRGGGGGGIFAAVSSSTPTRSTTVSTPFPPLALSVPNTRTGRVRSSSIGMINSNSNSNSNNNYGGVSIGESNKLFITSRQQPSSSNSSSVTTTRQQQSIPRSSLKLIPQQHHGHQYSLTMAATTTTTAPAVVVGSTSKLETTFEIDADGESVETHDANTNTNTNNSPARFRFTSFPASLPRVYHQHHSSTEATTAVRMTPPVCPGSVRKRMSFDTEDDNFENNDVVSNNNGDNKTTSTAATIVVATGRDDNNNSNMNNNTNAEETVYQDTNNHSRDDEGTQNTSISSLSVDGGGCGHHQHLPHLPNQHPPHFASAPLEKLLLFPGYNDDGGEEESLAAPVEAAAITGNVHNHPEESSDQIGMMGRTRLDFNVFLSPAKINNDNNNNNRHFGTKKIELDNNDDDGNRNGNDTSKNNNNNNNIDLSRPYEQNRSHSFPSTLSSHTNTTLMDTSNVEEISPTLSPPRTIEKNYPPETPREVQVHFPLLSECSPILGTKEHSNNTISTTTAATDDRPNNNGSSETSSSLVGDRLLPKSFVSSSHSSHFGFSIKQRENQRGEGSSASSSSGSTTTTQKRRLRPMPDMSAFENAKSGNGSRGDRSFDDGTFTACGDSRGIPSLNHRACPPTPQRTPAWANEGGPHAFFQHRQNSLITTKVLLTCPSQVLEGRSSLEDSVLDDDSRGGNGIGVGPTGRRISLSNQKKCDRGSSIGKIIKAYNKEENEEVNEDNDVRMGLAEKCDSMDTASMQTAGIHNDKQPNIKTPQDQITAPPKLMRRLSSNTNISSVISFSNDFEILRALGSGTFADVYKVRMKSDDQLYAVKRNRRQFRGKRDRDMALAEVQSMQRLQSVFADSGTGIGRNGNSSHDSNLERNCYSLYLLFFYRAWQEDGYFFSQTELCCRDTCREMLDSLRFLWNSAKKKYPSLVKTLPAPPGVQAGSEVDTFGRLVPNTTIWKICHDILAGLSHIHSHGIVHQDIKPSNIFLVANNRFGAMCKIGDFGMAGSIGSSGDGQEGDARYMPPELLTSATRHPSSDIFSLGLTLYEIAMDENVEMPSEGLQWHQLRSQNEPKLPLCHGDDLQHLIQSMTSPDAMKRPTADSILENKNVKNTGHKVDTFLKNYIADVEEYDRQEEQLLALDQPDNKTPRNNGRDIKRSSAVRSPSLTMLIPSAPTLFSPPATKYVVH